MRVPSDQSDLLTLKRRTTILPRHSRTSLEHEGNLGSLESIPSARTSLGQWRGWVSSASWRERVGDSDEALCTTGGYLSYITYTCPIHVKPPYRHTFSRTVGGFARAIWCFLSVYVPQQQFRGSRIVIDVDKREIIQTKYIGISQQSISDVQKTTKLTRGSISKIHPAILLCTSPCKYV